MVPMSSDASGSYVRPGPIVRLCELVPGVFGPVESPLLLATNSIFPLETTEEGYQPVGTKPTTRETFASAISTTATLLLSALAMKSAFPSGETATPSGVEPSGLLGYKLVEMISIADSGGG